MTKPCLICLTGGPGGGKTSLIEELVHRQTTGTNYVGLPEAISVTGQLGISSNEKYFQRIMVHLQIALEDGLQRALIDSSGAVILCHRGSLDPLAYWLDRGWQEEAFFAYTGTSRGEHIQRYTAVLHLVTAADGAVEHYTRWPEAHRPETLVDAVRLDRLLNRVWRDHPHYYRIDNQDRNWHQKAKLARKIISSFVVNRNR